MPGEIEVGYQRLTFVENPLAGRSGLAKCIFKHECYDLRTLPGGGGGHLAL